MRRHEFTIFADFHMMYLCDDELEPFMPEDVTNEDIYFRLRAEAHIMVVHTARSSTVPVVVEVHASEPTLDVAPWDHITDCTLEVPSGRLILAGTTDYLPDSPRIALPQAGSYRVRVLHGALDSLRNYGLDGDDHYVLALWPAPYAESRVVKQYVTPTA